MTFASTPVEVDPIAAMFRVFDSRVTMHDQFGMIGCIIDEILSDPQHVMFGLLHQRNAGTDACVDEKQSVSFVAKLAVFQKFYMRVGDLLMGFCVYFGQAWAPVHIHPVRGQCDQTAKAFMLPCQIDRQVGFLAGKILHEPFEHAVVIAFDKRPILIVVPPFDQALNNTAAIGATVDVIAQENDVRIAPAVRLDQRQRAVELGELAVDIPDNI